MGKLWNISFYIIEHIILKCFMIMTSLLWMWRHIHKNSAVFCNPISDPPVITIFWVQWRKCWVGWRVLAAVRRFVFRRHSETCDKCLNESGRYVAKWNILCKRTVDLQVMLRHCVSRATSEDRQTRHCRSISAARQRKCFVRRCSKWRASWKITRRS